MREELTGVIASNLINLFSPDLVDGITSDLETLKKLLHTIRTKNRFAELRMLEGQSMLEHKKKIKARAEYLAVQESTDFRCQEVSAVSAAKQVLADIEVLTSSPGYLENGQLEKLEQILATKRSLEKAEKNLDSRIQLLRELECIIW